MVGGGFGGLAAAARLAKLGHAVTLYERESRLGGVAAHQADTADGPFTMTLPAAIRDLFRKSGRPLERVVELAPVNTPRRHVFADGSTLELPLNSRSGQQDAFAAAIDTATADAWTSLVDGLDTTWERLRTRALEVPAGAGPGWLEFARLADRSVRGVARRLPDRRARQVLEYAATGYAVPPHRAPAFLAVQAYVERTFGRWTCTGGLAPLVDALADRLAERAVEVRLDTEVVEITGDAEVTGVRLADGTDVPADIVVCAVPPPGLRRGFGRTRRLRHAPPTPAVLLELTEPDDPNASQPFETVWHGRPALVLEAPTDRTRRLRVVGDQPAHTSDLVELLAERGLDLRDRIGRRTDITLPSYGPLWDRFGTARRLAPNQTSTGGLYCVGGSARPGPGVPYVLLGAASVAERVGKAT